LKAKKRQEFTKLVGRGVQKKDTMVSEDFRTPIDTLEKGRATLPKKGEKGFQSANVSENFRTHEKGRATDKVAKEVGFGSGRQYEKAKKVYEEAPEPIKKR